MKKLAIILILAVAAASASMARTAKEEIDEHIELAGNQYYAYPTPDTTHYTKAPKGYKPFYISTYQRHGSRFLLGKKDYTKPQEVLHKAAEKAAELPHLLVIDLGSEQQVRGIEYLPRAEQGAPGSAKNVKVFVY